MDYPISAAKKISHDEPLVSCGVMPRVHTQEKGIEMQVSDKEREQEQKIMNYGFRAFCILLAIIILPGLWSEMFPSAGAKLPEKSQPVVEAKVADPKVVRKPKRGFGSKLEKYETKTPLNESVVKQKLLSNLSRFLQNKISKNTKLDVKSLRLTWVDGYIASVTFDLDYDSEPEGYATVARDTGRVVQAATQLLKSLDWDWRTWVFCEAHATLYDDESKDWAVFYYGYSHREDTGKVKFYPNDKSRTYYEG